MGEAGSRPRIATIDREATRRAILRISLVALWVWPAFHALDVFMIEALYPSAPYLTYLWLRIVPEVAWVGVYVMARRDLVSPEWLYASYIAGFVAIGVSISLMALDFGGLHSAYVHGVSLAILVRCIIVPARFARALADATLVAVTFPAVMLGAYLLDPATHAAWGSTASLALFASHYVFVVGSTITGSFASHLAWSAQQQIYRARKLGRYRLEAPIGRGGMGEVWLAWDEGLKRKVALKLLRGQEASDPSALARFEREAHAASQLGDPHTIRIFDFGASDDGVHFIAMEYLAGADLAALVRDHGSMPPARAVRFLVQACQSLGEAHAAGVVHRDIKPHNLYVTCVGGDHDFLKVLDFGIARLLEPDVSGTLTRTGAVPGTPAYMAPELWLGGQADVRSDVYSLGATLHYLLTGAPPLGVADEARPSREEAPRAAPAASVPAGLSALLARCLHADPTRRFQSVQDLLAALHACSGLGEWTEEQARTFWQVTRPAATTRWTAQTEGA